MNTLIRFSFILLIAALLASCNAQDELTPGPGDTIETPGSSHPDAESITVSLEGYQLIEQALNGVEPIGDRIDILDLRREVNLLYIEVAYSGGCQEHDFELITDGQWPSEASTVNFYLQHEDYDDLCDAWLTETLVFDIGSLPYAQNLDLHRYRVTSSADHMIQRTDRPLVDVEESTDCLVEVTAQAAICGIGLYNDIWFSLGNGEWLQPVAIDPGIEITIVEGQRYLVGVTLIDIPEPYRSMVTCLAYPGPSEPVQINCIQAVD